MRNLKSILTFALVFALTLAWRVTPTMAQTDCCPNNCAIGGSPKCDMYLTCNTAPTLQCGSANACVKCDCSEYAEFTVGSICGTGNNFCLQHHVGDKLDFSNYDDGYNWINGNCTAIGSPPTCKSQTVSSYVPKVNATHVYDNYCYGAPLSYCLSSNCSSQCDPI